MVTMNPRRLRQLAPAGFVTTGHEDVHVHTHACDDASQTPQQALLDATAHGMRWVCFTAHVRTDTDPQHVYDYLDDVAQAVAAAPRGGPVVTTSVETKILSTAGDLDLPPGLNLGRLDTIHIADHQLPLDRPHTPTQIRAFVAAGTYTARDIVDALVDATLAAVTAYPGAILAHPLSVLPKCGIDLTSVDEWLLDTLAHSCADNDTLLEVNSKWFCPSNALVGACVNRNVPILSASDSHHPGTAGVVPYTYTLLTNTA